MQAVKRATTRKSRAFRLAALPLEILEKIFAQLSPLELHRLQRVSKTFRQVALTVLQHFFMNTTAQLFLHRYLPRPERYTDEDSLKKLSDLIKGCTQHPRTLHPAHQVELKILGQLLDHTPKKLNFWLRPEQATWFSFIPHVLMHANRAKFISITPEEEAIIVQQCINALPSLTLPEKLDQLEPLSTVLTPEQFYPVTQQILDEFCEQSLDLPYKPEQHFLPKGTNANMLAKLDSCFSQILFEKGRLFCDDLEIKPREISYNKMKKLLADPTLTFKAFIEGLYMHTTVFSRRQNARDLFKKTLAHPNTGLIQYLSVSGMNIFTPTENVPASTFAHVTAANRTPSVVREVVSRYFSLTVFIGTRDENWNTPLHAAMEAHNGPTAMFLVEAGSDFETKNRAGKTPLDLASPHTKEQILELIQRTIFFSPVHDITPRTSRGETPTFEGPVYHAHNPTPTQ